MKKEKPLVLIHLIITDVDDTFKFKPAAHKKWETCLKSRKVFCDLKRMFERAGYRVGIAARHDLSEASHIIFFDVPASDPIFKDLKKRRKELNIESLLIVIEPPIVNAFVHSKKTHKYFDKVIVFDPNIVDNKKYFLYHFPANVFSPDPFKIPFDKKKFLCITGGNKFSIEERELYSERKMAAFFFAKKPEGIDFYGPGWNKKVSPKPAIFHLLFRWKSVLKQMLRLDFKRLAYIFEVITNSRPLPKKIYRGFKKNSVTEIMSPYKFVLCFENGTNIPGYASERLYECLNARCVPVYLGDTEILKQVPKECYIDMRKFKNYEELYEHLTSISKKEYNNYINNINKYLKTAEGRPYSPSHFCKEIYDIVLGKN